MLEEDGHDQDADEDDDDGCVQTHFGSGWAGVGGLGGGGGGHRYADTPNNISRRTVLRCIYSTFVLSDHVLCTVTQLTSGLGELDLGISESFLRKLELGRGDACFGDDDNIVLRTPRTICAHTPHTTSKAHPPTPRSGL